MSLPPDNMMDPINSFLGRELLEEISPVVMVLTTPLAEDTCQKNGLNFLEMLLPFSIFNRIDIPVRTTSDQPYRLQMFKLRLFYSSDMRQQNYEDAEEKLKRVVVDASETSPNLESDPTQLETILTRLYKSGYVWQDLKDDDLITTISDNEYVLKGSLLQFHSMNRFWSDKNSKKEAKKAVAEHQVIPEPKSEPKTLRIERDDEINCDSPIKSDKSDRRMAMARIDPSAKKQEEKDHQRFKRSYSSRASHVFRNILRCGAADSVLVPISGGSRSGHHRRRPTTDVPRQQQHQQHRCETDNNSRKSRRSTSKSGGSSVSYKPLRAPNCSQCGRPFDPEKLHSHMQSCRALKGGRGKGTISTDRMALRRDSRSEDDFSRDSISGYLT